jgi:hypothetical protein
MAVVVDANLLITLVGNDPKGDLVAEKFSEWEQSGEERSDKVFELTYLKLQPNLCVWSTSQITI